MWRVRDRVRVRVVGTIVSLGLVDEAVEDVVDGLADEGAIRHELACLGLGQGLRVLRVRVRLGLG